MRLNKRASILTLGLFICCFIAAALLIERPLYLSNRNTKKIAAFAVRDNVSPFEKTGSALFTLPYLKKYYSAFDYYEAPNDFVMSSEVCPQMKKLLKTNDSLDVFILSHGNMFYQWFRSIDSASRKRIRLVYNTGCDNDSQYVHYANTAKYYVGHTGERSLSPVFYVYFLRRLLAQGQIEEATRLANEQTTGILNLVLDNADTIRASLGNYHLLKNKNKN